MEVSAFQVALLSVLLTWFWVCVVSDPSITPDPIPELQDWLTTGGAYIHPKLQIITNGTYRSVFVSGAVAANETLLRIPDSLILHHMLPIEVEVPENLLGNSYEPLFHTEFLRLVLVLLVEKRKGVKANGHLTYRRSHVMLLEYGHIPVKYKKFYLLVMSQKMTRPSPHTCRYLRYSQT